MISFIIIGRNEGWKLPKCIQSVFDTIAINVLTDFEVIYVDSKSTDNSIENAKKFKNLRIIQLTRDINAAIARNVGAKESQGDVLFFIDGDMEILPDFLPLVYSKQKGLIQDFVSGNWVNYNYDINDKLQNTAIQFNTEKDIVEQTTGGLFFISRTVWNKVGGMRPVFKKSQDIDLGFRLAKQGVFLLRKKELAAKHHTIAYMDKNRMWKDLFSWNHLYGRSVLYRKNLLNRYMYRRLVRNDYSMLILVVCFICSLLLTSFLPFIIYLFVVVLRSKLKFNRLLFLIIRDISSFLGLFVFFPKKIFNVKYKIING